MHSNERKKDVQEIGDSTMNEQKNGLSLGKIIITILYLTSFPALLLFASGDWFWTEGWIFGIWLITLCITVITYLYRKDPALLAERYQQPGEGNQKGWDKYVVFGLFIGFIAWVVIMPLDAKRFQWSVHFPFYLKPIGGIFLILSFFLFVRVFTDNTFLSPLVRLQEERKQKVITTGVYSFVRHPMYLAALLLFIGTPLLLGSYFGIVVGFLLVLLLAFRTLGEEKMLINELEGYEDYKKKVSYRFVPFVW